MPRPLILVADDEPYVVRSLSFVLRKEGFQVAVAQDGAEAIEKVIDLKPKVVFLDLQLPKIDGFEVCRCIKRDPNLKNTHIIVLTAKGQEIDKKKGFESGANEYFTKPFSPKEMVAYLRRFFNP